MVSYSYKKRFSPKRTYKPKTKKAFVSKVLKKSKTNYIKRIAKSVMKKKTETKFAPSYIQNNYQIQPYNTATNFFGSTISLITPLTNIVQGTGQGNRIGNKIEVVDYTVKGYITLQRNLSTTPNQNVFVKLLFIRRKNTNEDINNAISNNFFQNGNTTSAPQNLPSDLFRTINKDVYTVYTSRLFKLGFADGGATSTPQSNNDFSLCKMFRIKLNKHIKRIQYDDSTAAPTRWACWMVPLICNSDGTALSNATCPQIEFNWDAQIKYKDY